MITCHFCNTTKDVSECKHMYPDDPEKTICICENCYNKLGVAKTKSKAEQLTLTDDIMAYIKRWYRPFSYLAQFFDETDICNAVLPEAFHAYDDGTPHDHHLTEERNVPAKNTPEYYNSNPDYEYIKTEPKSVQNHDRYGRAYADYTVQKCNIYRTYHTFQHTIDGKVVETLLYQKYPELKEFEFTAYSMKYQNLDDYEIYPKMHIYVPFKALMNGDIEAIKDRNRKYAKSYNNGIYTPKETEKRLNSPEAQHLFDVIQNLKRN